VDPGTPVTPMWQPALARPLDRLPERAPGSLRRTMHVDVGARTEWGVPLPMSGSGRDVATRSRGGELHILAEASVQAGFDPERTLLSLTTTPDAPWAAGLVGARAGGGFRRRIDEVMPDEAAGSLLRTVLDDLPAAALISGYAWMRLAHRQGLEPSTLMPAGVAGRMAGLCSGWRHGGVALDSVEGGRGVPVQDCPPAPELTAGDDQGWHRADPLPPDWMRRRRCIDVEVGEPGDRFGAAADPERPFRLWAMFRDTVGEPDGGEAVLHEYVVEADGVGLRVETLRAHPRVLPFPECPGAAGAVSAMTGRPLAEFPSAVPETLTGITSCTHLNDLLRALGGAAQLVEAAQHA
jgi:Protein of unknown function (DUF2889)